MRLKSVRLQNIRSYASEEIVFPEGSVLLSGDIGSGKSTILLAIEFALFGLMKGSVDGASLLRHGKSSGYVELEFQIEGREIVIRRSLKRSRDSVSQSSGYIVVDGLRTECTPIELKARIIEMLGYPKSLLSKSKSLIYRYTVYTPQEEMKHILFEDASARLDTLRKVFQIDSYRLVRDNAAIVARSLKERIAEYSARAEGLHEKRKQLLDLNRMLKESAAAMESLLPLLEANQAKINQHRELVKKFEDDVQKLSILKSQIAALEASSAEKGKMVSSANEELAQLRKLLAHHEATLADSSILSEYSSNLGALHHHVSVLGSGISPGELQREIELLQNQFTSIAGEVVRAETQKSSSKRLEQNVLSSESCPVCLQPILEQHKSHFRQKVSSELTEAERTIAEKGLEQRQLATRISAAREKLNSALENERKLAEFSAISIQYSREAEELGLKPSSPNGAPYNIAMVLQKLSAAGRALNERSRIKSIAEEKKLQIASLEQRLNIVNSEIAVLKQQMSSKRQQLLSYSSLENDFSLARSRLERLQHEEKELLIKKASLAKETESLGKNAAQLQLEISAKEEDERLLEKSQHVRHWLDEGFINMAEAIEKSVMLRIYSEFNELFRSWFSVLMEDEAISARLDDSFSPVVEINGYETPLESLSGGEKTSCALAYRLALNKVINDVITTVKTRDVLILDEPTDGFSSEQLEKVRDVLEQLQLPQIIIVSHESKVESFVRNVVRIVKEQHVSRVLA